MTSHNNTHWLAPVLLIVALTVALGIGAPLSAHAAKISATDEVKLKVRKEEDTRAKKLDKSYSKQAAALAKQYEDTAKIIKQQKGDPAQIEALLSAAAYFKDQSKLLKK
jgi:uncharacterized protein HemX